ncbi:hypothetical protein HBI18_105180 [Parastagonospora nodorum]|nr:hypothetical protein HBI71_181150 [Parastagonospora nodorum]KAH5382943.1 hypothetical protein HBI33_126180 [Parastagonospora nodorum]KAH5396879.1 hypothetical protein HBI47_220870 [Parastagonospora nodorum]KAH5429425.1 hypothetical protein HBI32_070760 [Parastagonospora nodorum]KAH5489178.1 hypothetical protein HBI31_134820 [Parastagonospora nodorum]
MACVPHAKHMLHHLGLKCPEQPKQAREKNTGTRTSQTESLALAHTCVSFTKVTVAVRVDMRTIAPTTMCCQYPFFWCRDMIYTLALVFHSSSRCILCSSDTYSILRVA